MTPEVSGREAWPSAMLREFAVVFLRYRVVNVGICFPPVARALAERI